MAGSYSKTKRRRRRSARFPPRPGEGLPTGRTDLIRRGELAGYCPATTTTSASATTPTPGRSLGRDPADVLASIAPRNGFRPGSGVYIGRIWYTYPVNGITSGDFSGTVIADSYLIKDGRLAAPLQPNTLRMNDNAQRLLNNIIGIGARRRPTVRWSLRPSHLGAGNRRGRVRPGRNQRVYGWGVSITLNNGGLFISLS